MNDHQHPTRAKLLDAAERLFAEKGYENVSVRELAAAADANVAAVNYHFQGKENLLHEVIVRRFSRHRDATLAALDEVVARADGKPELDAVVGTLVSQHVHGSLGEEGDCSFLAFVTREMNSNETEPGRVFFQELVAPIFQGFSAALKAARPSLTQDDLNWIIASIIGQVHHFVMRRLKRRRLAEDSPTLSFIRRAFPAADLPEDEYARQVTEHVTRFSTAAIDALHPEVIHD